MFFFHKRGSPPLLRFFPGGVLSHKKKHPHLTFLLGDEYGNYFLRFFFVMRYHATKQCSFRMGFVACYPRYDECVTAP